MTTAQIAFFICRSCERMVRFEQPGAVNSYRASPSRGRSTPHTRTSNALLGWRNNYLDTEWMLFLGGTFRRHEKSGGHWFKATDAAKLRDSFMKLTSAGGPEAAKEPEIGNMQAAPRPTSGPEKLPTPVSYPLRLPPHQTTCRRSHPIVALENVVALQQDELFWMKHHFRREQHTFLFCPVAAEKENTSAVNSGET